MSKSFADLRRNNMIDPAQHQKDHELIDLLRETVNASFGRLTPEVEPAVIYVISDAAVISEQTEKDRS